MILEVVYPSRLIWPPCGSDQNVPLTARHPRGALPLTHSPSTHKIRLSFLLKSRIEKKTTRLGCSYEVQAYSSLVSRVHIACMLNVEVVGVSPYNPFGYNFFFFFFFFILPTNFLVALDRSPPVCVFPFALARIFFLRTHLSNILTRVETMLEGGVSVMLYVRRPNVIPISHFHNMGVERFEV